MRSHILSVLFIGSILFGSATVAVRADQARPVVLIDGWWSSDYAKGTCKNAKNWMAQNKDDIRQRGCAGVVGCPETMPLATACATTIDPAAEARDFESQLMTQVGINENCKGATFAVYRGPHSKTSDELYRLTQEPHWPLIIDFMLGASKQKWILQYNLGRILEGSSRTPAKMATDICAIVMGHGGTLVR